MTEARFLIFAGIATLGLVSMCSLTSTPNPNHGWKDPAPQGYVQADKSCRETIKQWYGVNFERDAGWTNMKWSPKDAPTPDWIMLVSRHATSHSFVGLPVDAKEYYFRCDFDVPTQKTEIMAMPWPMR